MKFKHEVSYKMKDKDMVAGAVHLHIEGDIDQHELADAIESLRKQAMATAPHHVDRRHSVLEEAKSQEAKSEEMASESVAEEETSTRQKKSKK